MKIDYLYRWSFEDALIIESSSQPTNFAFRKVSDESLSVQLSLVKFHFWPVYLIVHARTHRVLLSTCLTTSYLHHIMLSFPMIWNSLIFLLLHSGCLIKRYYFWDIETRNYQGHIASIKNIYSCSFWMNRNTRSPRWSIIKMDSVSYDVMKRNQLFMNKNDLTNRYE